MAGKFTRFDPAAKLQTQEDIAAYFEAVVEDGDPALLVSALGNVARARNMSQLSRDTGLTREGLYKALSGKGNPSFNTVARIAKALGYQIALRPAG